MIPVTPEHLRLAIAGRSYVDVYPVVVVALPEADSNLRALVARWLTDAEPTLAPLLTAAEIEALWWTLRTRVR